MKPLDAVVIGAGPAGSTVAIRLAQSGFSVALVEKAEFPRRKVCGEFISATTWPLLDEIGVGRELAARAGPAVERVGRVLTVHFGPETVVVQLELFFARHLGAEEVARAIDRIQRRLKQADRTLAHVFIEAESLAALGRVAREGAAVEAEASPPG